MTGFLVFTGESEPKDARTMAGRTILITGASSGIGAALARAYAASGGHLILWGRSYARLAETGKQCIELGATVETGQFDIADCDKLISNLDAVDARSPIDLAIFNAGLGGTVPRNRIAQSAPSTREMGSVNFISPLVGANILAEKMADRRQGHIVFVGSIAESFPLPTAPTYAATKAGVALFSEALRLRLKNSGVAVTLVSPGFVDTPMSRSLAEPRPFLISADKAASIIRSKLERKARR